MSTNEAIRELVATLVQVMAMDLTNPVMQEMTPEGWVEVGRSDARGRAGQRCSHGFVGYFERAFCALLPFEIFQPLDRDDAALPLDAFSVNYVLRIDVREIEVHVLHHFPKSTIDVEQLIATCIGLSGGHFDKLPTTRDWFEPRSEYLSLMQKLAGHQYAGQIGGQFRWTNKVGPAMRAVYMWDEDDKDFEDEHERRLETMWNTMPAEAKHLYFLDTFDPRGFAVYLSECWDLDGQRWIGTEVTRLPGEIVLKGGGTGIAHELYSRFVEPYRP